MQRNLAQFFFRIFNLQCVRDVLRSLFEASLARKLRCHVCNCFLWSGSLARFYASNFQCPKDVLPYIFVSLRPSAVFEGSLTRKFFLSRSQFAVFEGCLSIALLLDISHFLFLVSTLVRGHARVDILWVGGGVG